MQSWFASVIYGGLDRIGGLEAIRLQFAILAAVIAGLGWLLCRGANNALARTAAVVPFLSVAAFGWSHRPYVIGLLCLALVLLAADGVLDARWLIPIGWLWLNTHGGWPLGIVALLTLWLGSRLDGEDGAVERRALQWFGLGLAAGCLNPYGPELLLFPGVAVQRRDVFRNIVEWRAPTFDSPDELAFLVVVALAVIALRMRPTWRRAVPLIVFLAAALVSARNVQVAALVLLPGTAEGLRRARGVELRAVARPIAVLAAALGAVVLVTTSTGDPFADGAYPVAASDFLESEGLAPTQATVVSHDYVGNYWEARYGRRARVYIDDRVELLPIDVLEDYAMLLSGGPEWEEALERYEPDAVVWERDDALVALLRASDAWVVAYEDDRFAVAVRR